MKRLVIFSLGLFCLVLAFPRPSWGAEKTYYFPTVEINAKINPDSSVDFVERREFNFSGSFSRIYWDIPLSAGQQISGIGISEEQAGQNINYGQIPSIDEGRPLHKFAAVRQGKNEHIEAYHSSQDETKTFVLAYHLTGAVKKYQDVGEFYWKVIGSGWAAKTDLTTITVVLPTEVGKENIQVWGHGPLNGQAEIVDGIITRFTVWDLPQNQWVEIRELFPNNILSGVAISENHLDKVQAEEKGFQEQTIRQQQLRVLGLGLLGIGVIGWILFWVWMWFKHGKEYATFDVPKYVHFPPSKTAPALVEALLSQDQAITPNSFSATILDLARRKILKIEAKESYSKGILGVGGKKQYDYVLHWETRAKGLEKYEQNLIDFVFGLGDLENVISLEMLKKKMKEDPTGTHLFWQNWTEDVKKMADAQGFIEAESKKWPGIFIVANAVAVFLVLAIAAVVIQPAAVTVAIWGGIVSAVIFAFIGRGFFRWSKSGEKLAKQWEGFRNFLKDFSHFKDELPQALIIWEEMLVYGTALGVATQVSKYLPLILGQEKASAYYPGWYFVTNSSGNTVDFSQSVAGIGQDFGTSLSQSISSMTTAVTSSMSSGSGGGFSGGGGGGGD